MMECDFRGAIANSCNLIMGYGSRGGNGQLLLPDHGVQFQGGNFQLLLLTLQSKLSNQQYLGDSKKEKDYWNPDNTTLVPTEFLNMKYDEPSPYVEESS